MSDQQILERVPKQQTKLPEATRKVLFENDQVIVIETNYPVGGMAPMHVHRYPHILYVVEGGNLEVPSIDGKSVLTDASTGKVFWQEAQRHRVKNTGSTPMKIIEVEMKHANSMVKRRKKAKRN